MIAAGVVGCVVAAGSAHAATLTFDLNKYAPSVDPTPGQTLAVMTVMDIAGGIELNVSVASPAVDFGTGGVMLAINSNLASVAGLTPNVISFPTNFTPAFPSVVPGFGTFTVGGNAAASFAGPFGFQVFGPVSTANFVANADGYYVTAYVDLPNGGAGQIGGGIPESSTWAMMFVGFAGLGFTGYRARKSVAAAA